MDAFAENQMGRDDGSVPMSPTVPSRVSRAKRNSREQHKEEKAASSTEAVQQLLGSPGDALEPVDVPAMGVDESARVRDRWERKKSTFMPVADPYAEPDPDTPYAKQFVRDYCNCASLLGLLWMLLRRIFPVITWGPKINMASLRADVIAGLTVGVMLIPQSMSYADIAGLEYKYGMYTSVLPIIVYALMGTSRQLGVGPVAMVSLLVEVGLKGQLTEAECPEYYAQLNKTSPSFVMDVEQRYEQAELCPDAYAQLAIMTSLLVGLFQLAAGVMQLGFIVSFLAHPVISGFTSGAAIIIGLSQVQYFFGYKIPKSQFVYETLSHLLLNLHKTQYEQLLMGLTWWFMLSMSRRLATKYKKRFGWLRPSAPLITCILAIIVGANWDLFNGCGFRKCDTNSTNKLIVGEIPSGVSSMASVHWLDTSRFSTVLSTAVSCAVIGYMESIAIAKSLAAKHKYEVHAGQELVALGVANILGSFTSAYPVTGSFSRSAVNNQVGAQTQLAGLVTGLLLLFTLLCLTPLFYFLPKFALAAIVIASVTNLVDYKEAIHLWKVKKQDCALWVIAFLGTLFLGVQIGLLLAVGVSLALVIIESVRPQMTVLWRLPNSPIYRNIRQESQGHFIPGVMVVRIGASMYFANVSFIRDYISKMVAEFSEAADTSTRRGSLRNVVAVGKQSDAAEGGGAAAPEGDSRVEAISYIVIEMTPVTSIDSTALHMLEDMHRDLKERGIRLAFSTLTTRVEETLTRARLIDKMGAQWIHPSVHSAVQHCMRHRARCRPQHLVDGADATAHDLGVVDITVETDMAMSRVSPGTTSTPGGHPLPDEVQLGHSVVVNALALDGSVNLASTATSLDP